MIAETIEILRNYGVELAAPLSEPEITAVEETFGFRFGPVHRSLVATALPVSHGWWDWRNEDDATLRLIVNSPIDGILFDVAHDAFWPNSWGDLPGDPAEAARHRLADWPQLVPLCGHRFMLAGPAAVTRDLAEPDAAVYSVYQSDVIVYGANLLDYAAREFGGVHRDDDATESTVAAAAESANPWLRLAFGLDVR